MIDESCFQNATQQELKNWKFNNVYNEVSKSDQTLLNCRWICSMKNIDDKQITKARLVVKGSEEQIRYSQRFTYMFQRRFAFCICFNSS